MLHGKRLKWRNVSVRLETAEASGTHLSKQTNVFQPRQADEGALTVIYTAAIYLFYQAISENPCRYFIPFI